VIARSSRHVSAEGRFSIIKIKVDIKNVFVLIRDLNLPGFHPDLFEVVDDGADHGCLTALITVHVTAWSIADRDWFRGQLLMDLVQVNQVRFLQLRVLLSEYLVELLRS